MKRYDMHERSPEVGKTYRIVGIHPECSWHFEKAYFEGRLMECVEIFESGDIGFRFIKESDCPSTYCYEYAFCFYQPVVTRQTSQKKMIAFQEA